MKILITCKPGIGNMLQAIPLIKVCLSKGHKVFVYPQADSDFGKRVFDCWKDIAVVHTSNGSYDAVLKSPYNKGSVSISGKKILWADAMKVGESTLYCRLMDGDYPDVDITAPLWSNKDFSKYKDHVVMWPGCKSDWPVKRWPYFRKLATKLEKVIIIGQSNHMFIESIPKHCVNLVDKISYLPDLAALIRHCKAYIGNDGGISHLAATTGTPTNILFGMASIVKNRPRGSHVNVITKGLDCSPCQGKPGSSHRDCKKYGKPLCMTELTWKEVLEQTNILS